MPDQTTTEAIIHAADVGDNEVLLDPFKLWCHQKGLKDELVAALIDEGFDSRKTLGLMRSEDVDDMVIPQRGQIRLLQAAIAEAKNNDSVPSTTPPVTTPTTDTIPPATPADPGLSIDTILRNLPQATADLTPRQDVTFTRPEFDPSYHLIAGKSSGAEKPLDIVDFVGISCKIENDVEHVVSDSGDGNSLVLKSSSKKPKLESLTIWQWALGAIRINDELVRLGRLPTDESKRQYWGYCCKILELNARFEWISILNYDKEYRGHQARFKFPWGTEIPHLSSVQLKDKKPQFQNKSNLKGKQSTQSQNNSKFICRDFNKDRCTHSPCRFVHKCSVEGCDKAHPASKHDQSKNV